MYWFKKIVRAILNLLPVFVLSLIFVNNTSALKHNYKAIPYFNYTVPCTSLNSETGKYEFDYSDTNCSLSYGNTFEIHFAGDSYSDSYSDLSPSFNSSRLSSNCNSSTHECSYRSVSTFTLVNNNSHYFTLQSNSMTKFSISNPTFSLYEFGSANNPFSFTDNMFPSPLIQCGSSTGYYCNAVSANAQDYVYKQILPYTYTTSGFYNSNHAIDSNGLRYSYSFQLGDLFKNIDYIKKFSRLIIPLHTYDDYYFTPDNLYKGRSFELNGVFQFQGSFNWHENINNNGSYFRLYYGGVTYTSRNSINGGFADCTANLNPVNDGTYSYYLEYSCPLELNDDYQALWFYLDINGNGNYVWETDKPWYFAQTFVITDNDDTPGYTFNEALPGPSTINTIGSEDYILNENSGNNNDIIIDGANFSQSLIQLFGFTFINPFAPIFQMFSDNNSCSHIPTLASMLHSETDEICPWFDSSIRNVVTPVLSIASMMLIFGFAVRWLGSRSGNFIEDSEGHDIGNISIGKRGKK